MALKIMAVDDEPEILKLLTTILTPLGVDVVPVEDSREAAERLNKEKVDAVFVDVHMPNLDGFGLTRKIRGSPLNGGAPIVMVTGSDEIETMREGFKAGITFFLGKPIDPAKLRGLLNAARGAILKERRRHARLPFRTAVTCRFGLTNFTAESLDLGGNGMSLEPSGGLDVGQVFDLAFLLPGAADPLYLPAKVVRKDPPDRLAVEFMDLSTANKGALRNYFAELMKG